ncbi:Uncharacterized protein OBRU01_11731 [Operophtera brumata]|uniref:Uncharacterized protein n=1 Tax=Operophtera brumata TaxID=104452 RepID=A0A0L7LBF8_OPEBR|nr:Uncharacterized protein OBRU01_11731 [Operophtera brumata]
MLVTLYSGFYKHEVEANIVGAETLLHAMGYTAAGAGRLALLAPVCPDTVAAVSRDALVAHCECQVSKPSCTPWAIRRRARADWRCWRPCARTPWRPCHVTHWWRTASVRSVNPPARHGLYGGGRGPAGAAGARVPGHRGSRVT